MKIRQATLNVTISLWSLLPCMAMAQPPSVGIGTHHPHPSAILHLQSATGNQGFILPVLTTEQRMAPAFTGTLAENAQGMAVYDRTVKALFLWNGSQWRSASSLSMPYKDSLENAPNGTNLIHLIYKGNTGNAVGGLAIENRDPNNNFAPLLLSTNSTNQGAADIVVSSNQNTNDAIGVVSNGLGRAGAFRINNANNENATVHATNNGKQGSAALYGENTGNGIAIVGISNSNNFFTTAIYGEHKGSGDAAGVFKITNNQNTYASVYGETIGSGAAVYGQQLGSGRAGQFAINNQANAEIALRGFTNGTGQAGSFAISNAMNSAAALHVTTNGLGSAGMFTVDNVQSTVAAINAVTNGKAMSVAVRGQATNGGTAIAGFSSGSTNISPAIFGEHSGTGDAAAVFRITNNANIYSAVFGETSGSGAALFGRQTGTGRAGQFQINNASNTEAAVRGFTDGLGRAGFFTIGNMANNADVLFANTNGGGNVLLAQQNGTGSAAKFEIQNEANNKAAVEVYSKSKSANGLTVTLEGGNTGDAIYAEKTTGFGSAGNFSNQNASNGASILFAGTNAPAGSAIGTSNSGNGNALSIWGGGLRLSTTTLNGGGSILVRSAAYEISGGNVYNLSFTLSNGETFFFYNNTAAAVTVNGIPIAANAGRTCIVLNGTLRGM